MITVLNYTTCTDYHDIPAEQLRGLINIIKAEGECSNAEYIPGCNRCILAFIGKCHPNESIVKDAINYLVQINYPVEDLLEYLL